MLQNVYGQVGGDAGAKDVGRQGGPSLKRRGRGITNSTTGVKGAGPLARLSGPPDLSYLMANNSASKLASSFPAPGSISRS